MQSEIESKLNLEIFFEPLAKRVGHLVKSNKLFDPQHLCVVASRAGVKPLNDGADITEDTGIHQRCTTTGKTNKQRNY